MLNRADLESIHKFAGHNRELVAQSEQAGCFYCLQIFSPSEITNWIDGRQAETGDTDDGVTALCPRCGIDAVLPSAAPVRLNAETLSEMRRYWFDT